MDADRTERAKSIRAARDWLTGAEHALAGEDDLAGDLKLMLARAELARIAADRRARLRRWALRLLPPLAAAMVLAWLLWEPPPAEKAVVQPPIPHTEQRVEVSAPAKEAAERSTATEDSAAAILPAETRAPAAEERAAQEPPMQVTASAPVQPKAAAQPSRMPDADMQRLMQVGGKILRE